MIMFLSYLLIYFVYFNSTTIAEVVIDIESPPNSSEESKNVSSNSAGNSDEDLKYAPPDHVIPVSKYEIPREPQTRYVPITLEFVPTQIYAQVRGTHVAKRVPRRLISEAEGSDESRENAGRLKESVTDRKIHTVYTEEGYDNAAYDHAGHIRDGEYEESYEVNPSDEEKSKEKSLDSSGITKKYLNVAASDRRKDLKNEIPRPKRIKIIKKYYSPKKPSNISKKNLRNFVKNGNKVLEKDLKREFDEAEKGAETEVPDNLKNLGVEEDSRETSEQTNNDYPNLENRRSSKIDDEPGVTEVNFGLIDRSDDPTTTPDYGKIFWEFFKTEKPKIHVTRSVNSTNTTEIPTTTIKPDTFGSKIDSDKYPTLTKIKNYWKNSGINAKFYPKSKEEDDKKSLIKNSEEAGTNDGNKTEDIPKEKDKKKQDYVTIIRPPKNNDEKRNKESIRSSPEKVSYADFFSSGEGSNSSVSEESRSSEEMSNETYEKLPQRRPYRPAIIYRPNVWQLAGMRIQRYIHKLSHLLPPSPVRRSKYADYNNNNNRRKRGGVTPRDEPLSPVDKYLKPPPQEKLLTQTSKNTGERIKSTGIYQRNKRSTHDDDDIFNEAPKIVQEVIDKEIAERFPSKINDTGENENNSDYKNEDYSDEENNKKYEEKEDEKKVEIEVPEFDFEGVLEKIKSHDESKLKIKPELPKKIDSDKYPNYFDDKISNSSAIKFIIDPSRRVEKIKDQMGFYNSRDSYMNCEELDPDLSEIIPESSEESSEDDGVPSESPSRLTGLGDRMSCLQAKYFDKDPLDNPLFAERRIDPIEMPQEFLIDSAQMKQRLADISPDLEPRIDRKLSRKPEITEPQASGSNYQNEIDHPDGKLNRVKKGKILNHRKRLRGGELMTIQAPYHDEIYEDVMGTIKDMRKMQRTKNNLNKKSPSQIGIGGGLSTKIFGNRESDLSEGGWRKKLPRYRTKRVSYKTGGRKEQIVDHEPKKKKRTNNFRTVVRVHKRSVSNDDEGFLGKEEENREMIGTTGQPVVKSTEPSERIYAIKNRGKNSGTRVLERYGKFGMESTTGGSVTRRNEPRYDYPKDSGEGKKIVKAGEKGARRYDVLENVNEKNTKGISKDSEESRESFDASFGEEKYKDVDRSREDVDEDGEGPAEQVERPSEYYQGDSSEKSDESRESNDNSREIYGDKNSSREEINVDETWDDEEKNVDEKSVSEKEFERFVGRPSSFSESFYDPKYADLGPRINKPYFHHPAFGESESEEDDEDDRKSKFNSKYEYPWERQERLAKNKKTNQESYEDFDANSSESVQQLSRKNFHPPGKINVEKNSKEIIDNDKMASDTWPIKKFSSKTGTKNPIKTSPTIDTKDQAETIRQSVLNFMRFKNHDKIKNDNIIATTTFKPQIPPTSVTLMQKNQETTPMSELTTTFKTPRYTLRTISSRLDSQNKRKNHDNGLLKSASSIIEIKSPKKLIKRRERPTKYSETVADNPENISTTTSIPRRKLRVAKNTTEIRTTTINPRDRRKLRVTTEKTIEKKKLPVRRVEHRSRVSKEEIITETVEKNNGPGNHSSSVNKVSITTKETPNHIYRTEEINENGVRGKFITILPTNKSSINSTRDLSTEIDADKDDDEEASHESQEKEPITSNVHYVAGLMHRVPPLILDKPEDDIISGESSENNNKKIPDVKYTKEPDKRLYHFVDEDND